MIIVNYEVYVLEQSRGWMLHARFPRPERDTALEEAKEIERSLKVRVRVIRETYYTDNNVFEESEIYISGMKVSAPRTTSRPAAKAAGRKTPSTARATSTSRTRAKITPSRALPEELVSESFEQQQAPSKRSPAKARHLLGRLLVITALALAGALGAIKVTPGIIMFLWDQGFRMDVSPDTYGQLLFTVFILTFLILAVPLAIRFLPRQTEIPIIRRPHWATDPKPAQDLQKSLDKLASKALADTPAFPGMAPLESLEPPLFNDEALPEILPDAEGLPQFSDYEPEPIPAADSEPDPAPEFVQTPEPAEDLPPPPEPEPERPESAQEVPETEQPQKSEAGISVDALQPSVMRFLNGAVNAIKAAVPVLDSYNKFALHLYLAGGIDALCEFRRLGGDSKVKLTTTALETLGTKPDIAIKFHEKLDEYTLEPRYLGVVQAGRDAMGDFMIGDETNAHSRIKDVMKAWNKPAETSASIVTVMFTDMVGSTDLTQARGDAAAQEIVRSHNSIVRGALAQFSGREIKHTGDGIMASFASAANAVEATISIQRQVAAKQARIPNFGLHLRIGLNAGEPIQEDDDLFGATVQLAARVCAATQTDQTLCTGVVKDLSQGKSGAFRSIGNHTLKGFRDPVPLFEIPWK